MSSDIGEFFTNEYSFTLNGVKSVFKAPTVQHLADFRKGFREGKDEIEASIEFLIELGVKEEIAKSLTLDQLNTIMDKISDVKKN